MPEPDAVVTLAGDVGDVITGLTLVAAGVATWTRARPSRTGPLLVLAGAAWLAGDVVGALVFAHRGPLVHALLTFPTGRTRSRPVMVVIAAAYVDGLLPAAAREPWSTLALMVAVLSIAAWRWSAATGVERRSLLVPLGCAGLVGVPLTLSAIGRLTGTDTYVLATWTYEAAIVLTAWALAVNLLSSRSVRAAATGLIVDLADRQEPRALRDALSRSVGDPGLVIAYRVDPEWVDEVGQPVTLPVPEESEQRMVTFVEDGGSPVAALVHDAAALRDPMLAQSVGAAVRLVLANVRLQAEDAARTRDVDASRRRLIEAGDEQRRSLREQLRVGAEQTLADVSHELAALAASRQSAPPGDLHDLVEELDAAREDLARFAQGVHPKALTEHGLPEALRDLASYAAVPVSVEVPSRRFSPPLEVAAYFVCSEALANVAKYAEASQASIKVIDSGPRLVVQVSDDGQGGADPARGSGLRGLADRVEALGGRLSISSPAGVGTILEAELPIAQEAS